VSENPHHVSTFRFAVVIRSGFARGYSERVRERAARQVKCCIVTSAAGRKRDQIILAFAAEEGAG
jgi:hypothetical protein